MIENKKIKYIECPRDAMQGWEKNIPTQVKADYINALLKVGFDTIDFGSFVSPKAIPQMADTKDVLKLLNKEDSHSKLLAIMANKRGALDASEFDLVDCLGYPFSVSETFQQRNTNKTIKASFVELQEIQEICLQRNKQLVVYLSMGFGNPYGDIYNSEIVFNWVDKIAALGVNVISLADTVGLASPSQIEEITKAISGKIEHVEVGVHLHATSEDWKEKVDAAINSGCTRIDGAFKGIGGCPMAGNVLVGNMNTDMLIPYLRSRDLLSRQIDDSQFNHCDAMAGNIFI